jgi:hypothetical protein
MDPRLSALAAKKLLNEYTYLQSDDQLKKELIELNKKDFLDRVSKKRPDIKREEEGNEDPKKEVPKDDKPPIQVEDIKTMEKIKKVYRLIVKRTHPDKTKDERLVDLYMKATEAHDLNNLFELYLICMELNIQISIEEEDFVLLTKIIEEKKKEIKSVENSFIWLFINAPNEEEKEKIIDIYIKKYFS